MRLEIESDLHLKKKDYNIASVSGSDNGVLLRIPQGAMINSRFMPEGGEVAPRWVRWFQVNGMMKKRFECHVTFRGTERK